VEGNVTKSRPASASKSAIAKPRKVAPPKRAAVVLNGKQRRTLRGLAHGKTSILQIGKSGASPALLDELDRALETHELVKIRTLRECPTALVEVVELVEQALRASAVGTVGRVAILYRPRQKAPTIDLSEPSGQPKTETKKSNKSKSKSKSKSKRSNKAKTKTETKRSNKTKTKAGEARGRRHSEQQ
jgi:RNA-binding protein